MTNTAKPRANAPTATRSIRTQTDAALANTRAASAAAATANTAKAGPACTESSNQSQPLAPTVADSTSEVVISPQGRNDPTPIRTAPPRPRAAATVFHVGRGAAVGTTGAPA